MSGDTNETRNPSLVGTAYTVTTWDTTATRLYAIDSERDALVRLPSPNSGGIVTVGPLGFDTGPMVGFDIAPAAPGAVGIAYPALAAPGASRSGLFIVDLAAGVASPTGSIGVASPMVGIAVSPR